MTEQLSSDNSLNSLFEDTTPQKLLLKKYAYLAVLSTLGTFIRLGITLFFEFPGTYLPINV